MDSGKNFRDEDVPYLELWWLHSSEHIECGRLYRKVVYLLPLWSCDSIDMTDIKCRKYEYVSLLSANTCKIILSNIIIAQKIMKTYKISYHLACFRTLKVLPS